MVKTFLDCVCNKPCPYSNSCCRVPTEIIRHSGKEEIDILIFGQGAGKDEERLRRCFVGRSGKYMRKVIKHLWDSPEVGPFNIALSNNVRFHPMDELGRDREPTRDEIERCRSFLIADIQLLHPKVVVPVGKSATSTLLTLGEFTMGSVRGKEWKFTLGTIIPTYHPSFLTRNYGEFDPNKNNLYDRYFISDILTALKV